MSHVDEGRLHAYLDGAFASGDAHRVEIEAHLASCADCRARLDDARALKDRARDVLHHATPVDVHVPPFDVLRARRPVAPEAGAAAQGAAREPSSTRRLARSHVRLAWAASVVLAVGAGWMANELVQRDTGESAPVLDAARASSAEGAIEAGAREAVPESDERDRSTGGSSAERQPPAVQLDALDVGAEPAPAAASREHQAVGAAAAARMAQVDSPSPPAAVPVIPTESSIEAAPLARTAETLAGRDAHQEPLPAVADRMRRRAAAAAQAERVTTRPALADDRVVAGHVTLLNDYNTAVSSDLWSPVTTEHAAAALGGQPASIDNLRPIETTTAVVEGRVLVSQRYRLAGGAQLELIQRPAVVSLSRTDAAAFQDQSIALPRVAFESLAESLDMFRDESVVTESRPGLLLLLKGPISQDSLHAITARIR